MVIYNAAKEEGKRFYFEVKYSPVPKADGTIERREEVFPPFQDPTQYNDIYVVSSKRLVGSILVLTLLHYAKEEGNVYVLEKREEDGHPICTSFVVSEYEMKTYFPKPEPGCEEDFTGRVSPVVRKELLGDEDVGFYSEVTITPDFKDSILYVCNPVFDTME